jgi:Polyketide cyclase / dehydrase and lipid transport
MRAIIAAVASRASATTVVPGRIVEAEDLFYDPHRWAAWIDGFGHTHKLEGDWPDAGARLVWDSPPRGRGRVFEHVTAYEPRVSQTRDVEDERLRGSQTVAFEAAGADDVRVTLTLDYELKERNPFTPLVDRLFIRRELSDSLRRTLTRFGHERRAEITGS